MGIVRLFGDERDGHGAVDFYDGFRGWVLVCPDSSWTNEEASIVCRQLGYESGTATAYEYVLAYYFSAYNFDQEHYYVLN